MERDSSQNDHRDRQLESLAGRLRDTGVAPDRDLWPDIDAAIDRQEQGIGSGTLRRDRGRRLRFAAMAAALTLMLAAGWAGIRSISEKGSLSNIAVLGEKPIGDLAVIDQALDELTLALADDPENRNLTHLVLMIHKTRGNLLRRNSEQLVHE